MNSKKLIHAGAIALLTVVLNVGAAPVLDLEGYIDSSGAITVLRQGSSVDPYFAIQALLLAHDNGVDISIPAEKFANWLVLHQKPDGTFDRFCRSAEAKWTACKTADADDSLLALWMRLLQTMPVQLSQNPVWTKSLSISKASLAHLFQPSRGVYMVSPLVLHGLFMDNLEVWSLKAYSKQPKNSEEAGKLAKAIQETFWDRTKKRYLVSTQLEQRSQLASFYPDEVAQIFPLLVGFPLGVADVQYYRDWMKAHRAIWLKQGEKDYPWGLIAVLALRQNDSLSARCWLRQATPLRHSSRWAITDEASLQILIHMGLTSAPKEENCS